MSSVAAEWFAVDGETGLITTRSYLDCEAESNPRVIVVAEDGGDPRQTATATLSVSVTDVNDNVPLFESAFYEARLPEDKRVGECFLKVGIGFKHKFQIEHKRHILSQTSILNNPSFRSFDLPVVEVKLEMLRCRETHCIVYIFA